MKPRTPGRWFVDTTTGGRFQVIADDGSEDGLPVADHLGRANAILIAAAPDLLRELKRLVAAVDRLPSNPLDGLADEARAAIAKAGG